MIKPFLLLALIVLTLSVRRHEFKKCSDSNFCARNRHLAKNHVHTKTEGLRFDIDYEIKQGSISRIPGGVSFTIGSVFEDLPFLKSEIIMYTSGVLHTYIDEIQPLHPRYRTPREDVLNSQVLDKVADTSIRIEKDKVIWTLGDYRYELFSKPFAINGYFAGDITIKTNGESLMNFERYRSLDQDLRPSGQVKSADAPIKIFDAAGVYFEKGENLEYPDGLWKEKFRDWTDDKKKGPSSVAMDFGFPDASHVYGIPEHADSLALQDTKDSDHPYRLYNLDVFEFELDERMSLYGAVPFMLSRTSKAKSGGVFWLNPSETWIDISTVPNGKFSHWMSESGVIEFFLFQEESPIQIIQKYTLLTGPPQLPPLFSIAYHQCRWNYNSQDDLLEVSKNYEKHNIPLDVLWLDIEHTPERKYFNWDYTKFPSPLEMLKTLNSTSRKLVTIVDPHIKRTDSFSVHNDCKQGWYCSFITCSQSSGIY
ncbi:unnamed protein product [Blepharisma stoltei]|uniref:Glucosidase II subunit alpha n=1 Tax=Blepharisma stoltei TaxID=1481888 RepID=A0AAU9IQC8_9CILI|nr:unnamed protein product [Blepharisma stoltei]